MEGEAAAGGDVAGEELWDKSVVILRLSQSWRSQRKDDRHPIRGSYGVVCHQAGQVLGRTVDRTCRAENEVGIRLATASVGSDEGCEFEGLRKCYRELCCARVGAD